MEIYGLTDVILSLGFPSRISPVEKQICMPHYTHALKDCLIHFGLVKQITIDWMA